MISTYLPETYARARLFLGMSGVGFFVVLSTAALIGAWPQKLLPGPEAGFAHELTALCTLLGAYVLVSLPFDFLGGYFLPRRYGRQHQSPGRWLLSWGRGVLVHSAVLLIIAVSILVAGKTGGLATALVVVAATMFLLLWFQVPVAVCAGTIRRRPTDLSAVRRILRRRGIRQPAPVRVYSADDEGFTGGIAGVPGSEAVVIPSRWVREFDAETLALLITRRFALIRMHTGRTLGLIVAFAWNLAGVAVAGSLIPGAGVASVAELTSLALGFTVWSFLGLLILPSLSRYGVFSADRFAAKHDPDNRLEHAIRVLDRLQDDEPSRPPVVETIFHPLPAVESRLARLARLDASPPPPAMSPWNAARMSLYLSWAGLGLLSRAVHCNAGRPDLWVFLPVE